MPRPHKRESFVSRPAAALLIMAVCISFAQADGLPGEYVLTNRWRASFSAYSATPNPALLSEADYLGVRLVGASTLNTYNKMELGLTVPLGLYQSLGLSWFGLGTSAYEGQDAFSASGQMLEEANHFFVLSYARNIWRALSVGVNINMAYQRLFENNRFGIGADLGVTWRLLRHPLLGEHIAGIALANLIPPTLGSTLEEGQSRNERLSTSLELSLLSAFREQRIESAFAFSLKDLYSSAEDFGGGSGDKSLEWTLDARLGSWILRLFKLYGLIGFAQSGLEYGGFSLGFNLPSVNVGRDLSFLYQLVAMREGDANSHTILLRADLGRHREELYARRMARLLNIEPNDLYNRALALYSAGQYWNAYFIFGKIAVEYPDFFKRDWVAYYMGNCREHLDMRRAALQDYRGMQREFNRSAAIPLSELGIMRVYYRQGDDASVAQQFNRLNQPDTPDSIKYHAFYLMGQTNMRTGEYRKARQVLSMIPSTHPEYLFAQHSLAIANVLSGNAEDAIEHLRICVNTPPRNSAQRETVNRSLLLLGYLFYELSAQEGFMSQAVTALRAVDKSSYYYDEALLGLGWTAIRARQWSDCQEAGRLLIASSRRPPLRAEGALILAYAHMMRKEYQPAADILAQAAQWLDAYRIPDDEALRTRTRAYESQRLSYDEVAREAGELATSRQSAHVQERIGTLGQRQRFAKDSINAHLRAFDELGRDRFFSRSVSRVREDVEYALAVSKKLGGMGATMELQRKQQDIENELRRLREQVQELQQQPEAAQ